ncbi:hypothetical protein AVEN_100583-1 [Araneus ventricosus]|uniref:Uncharacterized protein n=1 Tax=Araneus ventricosus TaxID=182803 RepID=A0A4Y2XDW8_ARAVE|nr:hypothetical protein AVEN_100583-1 [Araneus ventricosus]
MQSNGSQACVFAWRRRFWIKQPTIEAPHLACPIPQKGDVHIMQLLGVHKDWMEQYSGCSQNGLKSQRLVSGGVWSNTTTFRKNRRRCLEQITGSSVSASCGELPINFDF